MLTDFNQWSSAIPYLGAVSGFVGGDDATRIAAYSLYEQIYWTIPEAFDLTPRGTDDKPIFIPSARTIVETLHRYLASGLEIIVDPTMGTPAEQALADAAMKALMARERFYSKFASAKRYGIIQGDWCFHITADPLRPPGSMISIMPIDPASYFPIPNPDNVDETIGAHIAAVETVDGKEQVHRVTYRKTTGKGGPSEITVEEAYFKPENAGLGEGTTEGAPESVVRPPTALPVDITSIPVYHIQNFDQPGAVWGSSEIRGIERLITAISQGASDEDLSLALEGLGVYHCDGGAPTDAETGEEVPWDIGPARVVEHPLGSQFGRVTGVSSVAPYQDHLKYIHGQLDQTMAMSEVAKGRVDVSIAESGVAMVIELGPLLARVGEKEQVVTDVLNNMLFDLRGWFASYESMNFANVLWTPTYAPKIPTNPKQRFDDIMTIMGMKVPIATAEWARTELRKIGFEFPDEVTIAAAVAAEQKAQQQIQVDLLGLRTAQGAGNVPPSPPGGPPSNGQLNPVGAGG